MADQQWHSFGVVDGPPLWEGFIFALTDNPPRYVDFVIEVTIENKFRRIKCVATVQRLGRSHEQGRWEVDGRLISCQMVDPDADYHDVKPVPVQYHSSFSPRKRYGTLSTPVDIKELFAH